MNNPFEEFIAKKQELLNGFPKESMTGQTAKQIMTLGVMAVLDIPKEIITFTALLFKHGCSADTFLYAVNELSDKIIQNNTNKKEGTDHDRDDD